MSDTVLQQFSGEFSGVYASLNQHDVEQFYAGYQLWWTQQRITALQGQISSLRSQISENAQQLQQFQPPAVAFATLARLQANGVDDIDLLDRMLERGEEWLDLTMQRLDYCEQLNFIHDNYTQWCEHALEGAYDWIDSMRVAHADTAPRPIVTPEVDEAHIDATEELLIRKLTSEEGEESQAAQITLKRPAVSPAPAVEETPIMSLLSDTVDPQQEPEQCHSEGSEESRSPDAEILRYPQNDTHHEDEYVEFAPALEVGPEEAGPLQEADMSFPSLSGAEADLSPSSNEQAKEDEYIEFAPALDVGTAYKQLPAPVQERKPRRRHSSWRRLLATLWP